jgi:hypothetical protein
MMQVNNIIEDLMKYFETTPREKVLENWTKSESFDEIGPTMDEFLEMTTVDNPNLRWDVQMILSEGYDLIGISSQMGYDVYVFSNIEDAQHCYNKLELGENRLSGWFYDLEGWEKSREWYKFEFKCESPKLIKISK